MDNILEKHLAAALLLSKEHEEESKLTIPEISQNIIPYYSYKEVGNSNYIKLTSGLLRTETVGFWKNKPVFLYNEERYVVLENSKTIVRTESLHITDDQIEKYRDPNFLKQKEFNKSLKSPAKKIKASVQSKLDPLPTEVTIDQNQPIEIDTQNDVLNHLNSILPKEDNSEHSVISSYINKIKKYDKEGEKLDAESPKASISDISRVIEEPKEDSVISSYIKGLKTADNHKDEIPKVDPNVAEYIKSDKPKTIEDEIFSIFDSKKDDPRIKRFFSYFADQTKKEVHEINEKYSQQYFAKILETSGGGGTSNSAVDYAKGGTMEGDLTITNNLSVLGNIYGILNNKRVFNIGNNVDTDYVLDHNFGTKDLVISVYDVNDEIVLASVKNINTNQTLISFSEPIENIKVVIMR
jgi:hypothetical protein